MTLFPITQRIKNPTVIITERTETSEGIRAVQRNEVMHLVMPYTSREVFALQFLEHQVDKFAPASGNGVLITENAYRKLNA
jgi:hypothetical protein